MGFIDLNRARHYPPRDGLPTSYDIQNIFTDTHIDQTDYSTRTQVIGEDLLSCPASIDVRAGGNIFA